MLTKAPVNLPDREIVGMRGAADNRVITAHNIQGVTKTSTKFVQKLRDIKKVEVL